MVVVNRGCGYRFLSFFSFFFLFFFRIQGTGNFFFFGGGGGGGGKLIYGKMNYRHYAGDDMPTTTRKGLVL